MKMKKVVLGIVLALLSIGMWLGLGAQRLMRATYAAKTWYVGPPPSDFTSIQEAIDNETVSDGDIVEVKWKDTPYYENVTVRRPLKIRHYSYDPAGYYPTVDGVNKEGIVFRVIAPDVEIDGFIIQNGEYGIRLLNQSARILNNTVTLNVYGIVLTHSYNNTLTMNKMSGNTWNFGVSGSTLEHYIHDIDDSNTVDGKPIYYWVNQHDKTIPPDAGYVAVVNSTSILVKNLELKQNLQGVLVAYSNEVIVEDMEFIYPSVSVYRCVEFINTANSVVENLTISDNNGIFLVDSEGNIIRNNKLSRTTRDNEGVNLWDSDNNLVIDNTMTNCLTAISLYDCLNNTLVGNTMARNSVALALDCTNNSIIFHNNFLESDIQHLYAHGLCVNNRFDSRYEGNFWDTYDGEDDDCDGIGDTPHLQDTYGEDNCPLMNPWKSQRIFRPEEDWYTYIEAIGGLNRTLSTFSNSTVACLSFNRRLKQISLKATSGYSGFLNITIPRNWLDYPFTVSVDKVKVICFYGPHANYSSLYITYGPGTHTIEINGTEIWGIRGDLNGDGVVDIADVAIVTGNYRAKEEEVPEQYNLNEADPQA